VICSGGSKPGELRSLDTPENRGQISQVVLNESKELLEIVGYVSSSGQFKTVVLDHATGFQDLVLKEILGLEEIPAQKTWGLASQQQYGQLALQCKEFLRALLGLSSHVVIVAQEREFNTEGTSDLILPSVGSGLTPSLTGWLNTAVDYICQTYIRLKTVQKQTTVGVGKLAKTISTTQVVAGEVEYCLRTAPDPVFTTKFRLPKGRTLPTEIVDPDFSKIYELIRGR